MQIQTGGRIRGKQKASFIKQKPKSTKTRSTKENESKDQKETK